jgi:hypothetical protein
MKRKIITVKLTPLEARELLSVATNGYADGDYYPAFGNGYAHAAYIRAAVKVRKAISHADGWTQQQPGA